MSYGSSSYVSKFSPQPVHRAVQLRLDRSDVNRQGGRDLVEIHLRVEPEAKDLALPLGQLCLALPEPIHRLSLHRPPLGVDLVIGDLG